MGYVLRVRFASFFTGAALASAAGLYFLHKDYKIAHHAISQQLDAVRGHLRAYTIVVKIVADKINGD